MTIILLILIFIRPFISSLAFPYTDAIYSMLLLGSLGIYIALKGVYLKENKSLKAAVSFIIILSFLLIFYHSETSGQELYKYTSGILLFLICSSIPSEDKNKFIFTLTAAGILISFLAIYQYLFGFHRLAGYLAKEKITNPFFLDYVSQKRVFSPFVTPNTLGGYLAMIIPLSLIYKYRLWLTIPLFLALLLTKSVGSLLSLFSALILYFYILGRFRKIYILFLLGLLAVISFIFIARAGVNKEHLQPLFSTAARLKYWQDTLETIKVHPFTGIGLGNFNLPSSRYSHNSYLQLWAETGIFGLISFLWLVTTALKAGLKKLRESPKKVRDAALIAASCAFLIHNLIDFNFFLPEISLLWWAILGLLSNRNANSTAREKFH